MTDKQPTTESGTERLLRIGTLLLTALSPVLNTLASRLADRLERGGKRAGDVKEEVVAVKQPLGDALRERGEVLVQELEDLVERGAQLSQSLLARGSEATHDLAERGSATSQDLLRRSEEIRGELGKRGENLNKQSQKLAKDLNKRSQKVAKELSQRSEKVTKELSQRSAKVTKELSKRSREATKELSKRSRAATHQVSEHNGTFWVVSGFVVGLAAAGITAYLLIRQRVQQQQQLDVEPSFALPQNGYLSTPSFAPVYTKPEAVMQKEVPSPLAEDTAPAVAVATQENKVPGVQSVPSDAAFIGVVGTQRYYPVSTPLDQLGVLESGKKDVIYFTTEEEAQGKGYSSGL
jgi:hypothetical protein